tara:strand:- start:1304 stop:1552 length:249 start_codon:yes stop_codon:yes gene_type:complete
VKTLNIGTKTMLVNKLSIVADKDATVTENDVILWVGNQYPELAGREVGITWSDAGYAMPHVPHVHWIEIEIEVMGEKIGANM